MYYTKTDNYDHFRCIADQCPESCCIGWQIVIDEDSLEAYAKMEGEAGALVKAGVDFEEGCFKQFGRRCSMLADSGLCRLQLAAGEKALCVTCDMYPRHIEEFEGEREYSLSLSCPEAARIILGRKDHIAWLHWEDDEDEVFEDFDDLLYQVLLDAREVMFTIIQRDDLKLLRKMQLLMEMAAALQDRLDDDRFFEMQDVISAYEEKADQLREGGGQIERVYDFPDEKRHFSKLFELEYLHDNWEDTLLRTFDLMFGKRGLLKDGFPALSQDEEIAGEQLLMFFIYTYFDGAVYDDMIFSKTALSVYSVKWIFYIYRTLMTEQSDAHEVLIQAAYTYAREIEHSDINLDTLEEWFDLCTKH